MKKDHGAIYDLLDQETRRMYKNDRAAFIRSKGNIEYLAYEIVDVRVDAEQGHASVQYTWTGTDEAFKDRPPIEATMVMDWVLENGEWRWHQGRPDPSARRSTSPPPADGEPREPEATSNETDR